MTSIRIPLQLTQKGISRDDKLKKSIDAVINLIITTERFSTPADPQFGFVFNNLRFEMFNENEGVVYDSGDTDLIIPALIFPGIGFTVLFGALFGKNKYRVEIDCNNYSKPSN